jgi:hypothetical protein
MCLVACLRSVVDGDWGATAGTVKLLLPPRQSRGISLVIRQLDEVSALPPEYPGWALPFQGADRLELVDRWERFREASKSH